MVYGGHLEFGRHFEIFRWLMGFLKRASPEEHVCQIWCFFPEVEDYFSYLLGYYYKIMLERDSRHFANMRKLTMNGSSHE